MASELQWQTVETSELSEALQVLYSESKEAYRAYKAARDRFEDTMRSAYNVGEGNELKFGYNFGKLSVAIGPKVARKAKSEAPKQSLAEWLVQQRQESV